MEITRIEAVSKWRAITSLLISCGYDFSTTHRTERKEIVIFSKRSAAECQYSFPNDFYTRIDERQEIYAECKIKYV